MINPRQMGTASTPDKSEAMAIKAKPRASGCTQYTASLSQTAVPQLRQIHDQPSHLRETQMDDYNENDGREYGHNTDKKTVKYTGHAPDKPILKDAKDVANLSPALAAAGKGGRKKGSEGPCEPGNGRFGHRIGR